MTLKERYAGVIGWFEANMPVAESELQYKDPYQLLVAVILSAQCTDKRVNMTTPALFEAYPTPEAMAQATAEEIYAYIKSISYPNNKARNLAAMARMLCTEFGGVVPSDLDALQRLPGVGPHTARLLWEHFDSVEAMRAATREEIAALPGIGRKRAEKLWQSLHMRFERPFQLWHASHCTGPMWEPCGFGFTLDVCFASAS